MHRSTLLPIALVAGGIALALLPGAASASSIAFIKDDNVWLTSPDGSRQRQVTTDGTDSVSYNWPSQADDGTILAKRGDLFVRLRPNGTMIGTPIPAIGSDIRHSGGLTVMAGPADPRISPDGKRFAYWISARNLVTCPPWEPGCTFEDTDFTIVSRVDRFTGLKEIGSVRSYRDPSWIGNNRLLVFNYGLGVKEGAIFPVGRNESALRQWFDPPNGLPQIGQGQLTRRGDKLVTLAGSEAVGPSQQSLYLYGVTGYPAPPVPKCYVAQGVPPSGKFIVPSWSPDGTALAVTESDGIHIFGNIPDLRAPNPNCGQITDRLLVAGYAPGWGPADVPAKAPASAPGAARVSGLVVARRQRGRAVKLRLSLPAAGTTVRARLRGRGRMMGAARRRSAAAGRMSMRVPLSRRGRAALRRQHRLRLAVRVAVIAPDGATATARRRVTLAR